MVISKKWGQGQIFAFSALDGKSCASDDFVGLLSGDRVGIKFFTKVRRELSIVNLQNVHPSFEAVTGDYICIATADGEKMHIIYADTHLIIGNTVSQCEAVVFTEGMYRPEYRGCVEIHNTDDGEYTALARREGQFAFAYGKSSEEAAALAEKGLTLDMEAEAEKKLAIYKKYSLPQENPHAELYAKCISVMKTQLYSPEGNFKRIWSTPDRLPHRNLWLWDSVFHAVGHRNMDASLAENLILAIFDVQKEDGFIPHMGAVDFISGITQPPVIAWGAYQVYRKSGNREFLRTVLENNKKFLLWCRTNRRDTEEELYTWLTQEDKHCRCDESGMDNSPRFDVESRLQAIDFSCFMANDVRYMKIIAQELGDKENAAFFGDWYEEIKNAVNGKLWCKEEEFYYDYDILNDRFNKVQSVASFLPLFAGICSEDRAKALVAHLTNPETFYTEFPIPSISKKDKTFGSDMWRGPVWINYNYLIAKGLSEYGFSELSKELTDKTIEMLDMWYRRTGTIYEFYDCENRKAPSQINRKGEPFEPYDIAVRYQSIRDYGWSCTLLFDMLM